MMKKTVILSLLLVLVSIQYAGAVQLEPRTVFNRANKQLKQGHIRKALSLYHKVEQRNIASGALFINMGISYLRLGSLAKAEYYFLKAKHFKATVKRAKKGINYVQNNLSHQSAVLPTPPWQTFFTWLNRNVDVTILLAIGIVLINLSIALFILPWFIKRFRKVFISSAILLVVIGVLAIFSSFYINYRTQRYHKAVMITQKAKVKKKPSKKAPIVNKAYNGYIFTVDKQKSRNHKGWSYIRMRNGQYGWIRTDEIMVL